jgi:hypothetical protein
MGSYNLKEDEHRDIEKKGASESTCPSATLYWYVAHPR